MRIRLDTLGCRLNIGEIDALARGFAARGHRVVAPGEPADLCVLNTCTVTALASRKSRQLIRQVRRAHPGAALVVTGCYAEMAPEAVRALGVDLVVGNRGKDDLADTLAAVGLLDPSAQPAELEEPARGGRTRAFVKVQDGCDNRCAFCIVTVARGEGRSRPGERVVAEVRDLAARGFREVVLSGVHLGSYGHDRGDRSGLARLVRRLLDETVIERLRLSSLEPWDLDAEFFGLFSDPRLLPHLHLPLQSGCDATLRRMARRTTRDEFSALLAAARAAVPDLAVSSDVMVGFPGESEAEFEQSVQFVEEAAFSRLHVFRFSPREGTRAATMPRQVPGHVAERRSRQVHELGARLERRFHESLVGRTVEVLWETAETLDGRRRWSGLTGNYARVLAWTGHEIDLTNEIRRASIVHPVPGAVLARLHGDTPRPTQICPLDLRPEGP